MSLRRRACSPPRIRPPHWACCDGICARCDGEPAPDNTPGATRRRHAIRNAEAVDSLGGVSRTVFESYHGKRLLFAPFLRFAGRAAGTSLTHRSLWLYRVPRERAGGFTRPGPAGGGRRGGANRSRSGVRAGGKRTASRQRLDGDSQSSPGRSEGRLDRNCRTGRDGAWERGARLFTGRAPISVLARLSVARLSAVSALGCVPDLTPDPARRCRCRSGRV
jgi:hypothetical protein